MDSFDIITLINFFINFLLFCLICCIIKEIHHVK